MKRFCLLVISLCVVGPIYVDCYPCNIVETIKFAGELSDDDQQKGAEIATGDVAMKCAQANDDAIAEGVNLKSILNSSRLRHLFKFLVDDTNTVIGLLCYDNPMIILGSNEEVYAI